MKAKTEFLLREALTLLLDDPTPRNVAQAMGLAYTQDVSQSMESQTEESESQAPFVKEPTPQIMMVKTTYSTEQRAVLVDRSFSIDAFIPHAVTLELKTKHGFTSIGKLRGSVVRIDKYHFSSYERCYALDNNNAKPPRSRSLQKSQSATPRLCLFVEALQVVDASELVVEPLPDLLAQPAIAAQLKALSSRALEQRTLLRQGLAPVSFASPSPAKLFDERNPLRDEDCEIPEEQERELDAQEGWGEQEIVEPTDSQLIAENGPVSSGDSQSVVVSSGDNVVASSSANSDTFVASSGEIGSDSAHKSRLVVPETETQSGSPGKSQANDEASVPDSQDYHFRRENLTKAFVDCSDTDSEGGEVEDDEENRAASQSVSQNDYQGAHSSPQAPFTQRQSLDDSLTLTESLEPTPASQASQPPGEFVGSVRPDHDEPMTQAVDESQALSDPTTESGSVSEGLQTQTDESNQPPSAESEAQFDATPAEPEFGDPSDDADNITPNEVADPPSSDGEHTEGEEKHGVEASQQDGQVDHWMQNSQPTPQKAKPTKATPSPAKAAARPASEGAQNVTQRRKRRRSSMSTADSQALSPQEPNAKGPRTQRTSESPASTARSSPGPSAGKRGPASPQHDSFGSFATSSNNSNSSASQLSASGVSRVLSIGISSLNNKANQAQLQGLRPAKRYQHLLPPFDLETIKQQILNKKN